MARHRRLVIIIVRERDQDDDGMLLSLPTWVRWVVVALVVLGVTSVLVWRATH